MLEAVQKRLDENPQAMRMRRETVEHPFGTLKMRMGATHFLMKRLPKVATEMALARARLQSHARHEHRRRQAADRGDRGLRRPGSRPLRASEPLRMRRRRTTVASRPKSEKYARNGRIAAHPPGQGRPTPPPARYHAAKTQSGHCTASAGKEQVTRLSRARFFPLGCAARLACLTCVARGRS